MTAREGEQRPVKPVYLSGVLTVEAELSAGRLYDGSAHAENASRVLVALVFIGGAANAVHGGRERPAHKAPHSGTGLEAGDLDNLVHDAYSRQASKVNNGGLDSQVRFLIESYGTGGTRSLLSDLRPAAAGRASAGGTAAPAAGAGLRPPSAPGR